MSKPIFVVSFERETPVHVRADRVAVSEGRLFFYEYGRDKPVANFTEFASVSLESAPDPAEPCAALVAGAEPIRLSAGVSSCFLSPASPLVEAIESAVRLLLDVEGAHGSIDLGSSGVPGRLMKHLDELLCEQWRQLIALSHDHHPAGPPRRG